VACLNRDSLNANEFTRRTMSFDFQAQFDGFTDTLHEFVERTRLGVAARQLRDAGDVISSFISLDNDAEFVFVGFSHDHDMPEKISGSKAITRSYLTFPI
jgi:hypothetical protein